MPLNKENKPEMTESACIIIIIDIIMAIQHLEPS